MSRRAAYVEWTVRECQDAIQLKLVQIRYASRSEPTSRYAANGFVRGIAFVGAAVPRARGVGHSDLV